MRISKMTWIITANTNNCRIYDFQKNKLELIEEIDRPENKLKGKELESDKPGRFQSGITERGAFAPHTELEDKQITQFAKELADKLNKAKNRNEFEKLTVVMPAQIEGIFSKHLDKNVKELIERSIQKNIMHLSEKELLEFINKNIE